MVPHSMDDLLARQTIAEVVCRYARGIDRLDLALVRECFHPDATDDHGEYKGGIDGLIDWLPSALGRYESSSHVVANQLVDFVGDDVALVETYCVGFYRCAPAEGEPSSDVVSAVRYLDRFECRSGDWRIAQRVCVFDWNRRDLRAGERVIEGASRGSRGRLDPLYQLLATRT